MEELGEFIGEALSDVLEERGMQQIDVAIRCALPPSQVSKIFRGKNTPTYTTLFKICSALEVRPEVFLFKAVTERNIKDKRKKKYIYEYEEMMQIPANVQIDHQKLQN